MLVALKMALGALVVLVIHLISSSKISFLAGLIPLFPTFTVIALYSVGVAKGGDAVQSTILFGMFSVLPYLAYLASVYLLVPRLSLSTSLCCSVVAWLAAASVVSLVWQANAA